MVTIKDIYKYDTILIDEAQDYEYDWFQLIKKYFLKENGEYVIFADEKQNIYNRILEIDNKPKTNIPGAWNQSLNKSLRLSKDISSFAEDYQKYFWSKKYEIESNLYSEKQTYLFSKQTIQYFRLEKYDPDSIVSFILERTKEFNMHINDVAVLAPEIEKLRELDLVLKRKYQMNTTTVFESHETYESLSKTIMDKEKLKLELDSIRRSKKINFWRNHGTIKLSTIHSFKGWEIDTLFLLLHPTSDQAALEELIYTGITRAKNKLFILNLGLESFHEFAKTNDFLKNIMYNL
jgi:superfamily I DNA/RNA helicase